MARNQLFFIIYLSLILTLLLCAETRNVHKKCKVTHKEAERSFVKMFYFGDYNVSIATNDAGVTNYCEMMRDNINTLAGYVRCLKPFPKTVLALAFRGYRKFTKQRCKSRTFRRKFAQLGTCVLQKKLHKRLHKCVDDAAAAFDYIYVLIPVKDQIPVGCCIFADFMSRCFGEKAAPCGSDLAHVAYQLPSEPAADAFELVCSSHDKCEKIYAHYLKEVYDHVKRAHKSETFFLTALIRVLLGEDDFFD